MDDDLTPERGFLIMSYLILAHYLNSVGGAYPIPTRSELLRMDLVVLRLKVEAMRGSMSRLGSHT